LDDLGFPPAVAPAGFVGEIAPLGNDAFEADGRGVLEQLLAAADDVLGVANPSRLRRRLRRGRLDECAQAPLALLERQPIETFTVSSKQIEYEVDQRRV